MATKSAFFLGFGLCWIRLMLAFECEIKRGSDLRELHVKIKLWHHYQPPLRGDGFVRSKFNITQGQNYAGIGEFPWLVEMREKRFYLNRFTQNNWANGIMVTAEYMMTTCEAVAIFHEATNGTSFDDTKGSKNWHLDKKNPSDYIVMYALTYPFVSRFGRKDAVGSRNIIALIPHPKCNYFVMDYSLGVAKLEKPMYPFPPYTSYTHMDWNCTAFQDLKVQFNKPIEQRARDELKYSCVIGLWGRKIFQDQRLLEAGMKSNYDFKLRYWVRFVDPEVCKENIGVYPKRYRSQPIEYFECMGIQTAPFELIGAICHHDQGAPIMCNGVVRAMLLAGATREFCNNSRPLPFLVIDARFMYTMYTHIHELILNNMTSLFVKGRHFSGAPRPYIVEDLFLLFFVFLPFFWT